MGWLTTNWFWVLIAIAFIAMHLFGHGAHGGHGGHGGDGPQRSSANSDTKGRRVNTSSIDHQH